MRCVEPLYAVVLSCLMAVAGVFAGYFIVRKIDRARLQGADSQCD